MIEFHVIPLSDWLLEPMAGLGLNPGLQTQRYEPKEFWHSESTPQTTYGFKHSSMSKEYFEETFTSLKEYAR